jgi:processive 1,2-diacylglycerol beta-glucosyltransferase
MTVSPKIAVLWGSTGYGHQVVGECLSDSILEQLPTAQVVVRDVVTFLPPIQRIAISLLWKYGSNYFPSTLECIRQFGTNTRLGAALFRLLITQGSDKFDCFCRDQGFDLVLTTHPIATVLSSFLKTRHGFKIFAIATDFSIHRLSASRNVERLFVPPLIGVGIQSLESISVTRDKIFSVGIPISEKFSHQASRIDSKVLFGYRETSSLVLVSFGGSGTGAMAKIDLVKTMVHQFKKIQFAIVCGHDREASNKYQEVLTQYSDDGRVKVFGYTTAFHSLVAASDVYLGKAGGVTISEILNSGLPIGILGPVWGIERANVLALEGSGLGKELRSDKQLAAWLARALNMNSTHRGVVGYGYPSSSATICEHVLKAVPST